MLPYFAEKLKRNRIDPNVINDYVRNCKIKQHCEVSNKAGFTRYGIFRPENFGQFLVSDTRFMTMDEFRT